MYSKSVSRKMGINEILLMSAAVLVSFFSIVLECSSTVKYLSLSIDLD